MFCALLTSRYQVSVYRTNGPLVRFVPESQLDIPRIYFRHGCAPSHRMGYFTLGASCNRINQRTIGPVNAHLIS